MEDQAGDVCTCPWIPREGGGALGLWELPRDAACFRDTEGALRGRIVVTPWAGRQEQGLCGGDAAAPTRRASHQG